MVASMTERVVCKSFPLEMISPSKSFSAAVAWPGPLFWEETDEGGAGEAEEAEDEKEEDMEADGEKGGADGGGEEEEEKEEENAGANDEEKDGKGLWAGVGG